MGRKKCMNKRAVNSTCFGYFDPLYFECDQFDFESIYVSVGIFPRWFFVVYMRISIEILRWNGRMYVDILFESGISEMTDLTAFGVYVSISVGRMYVRVGSK